MNCYGYRYVFNLAGYPAIFNIRHRALYPASQILCTTGYKKKAGLSSASLIKIQNLCSPLSAPSEHLYLSYSRYYLVTLSPFWDQNKLTFA
jgi:hypothetical protein